MRPKFKVLDIKKVLKDRVGLYSYNIVDPSVDFLKSYANYHMIFILIPFFLVSSTTFILGHLSEFSLLVKSGVNFLAGIQCTGMFLSIALNKKSVEELHGVLQEIVDEGSSRFKFSKCQILIEKFIYKSFSIR